MEKNALELAVLGVRDNGTELAMALKAEPGSAAGTIRYYGEALDKIYGEIAPTDPNFLALVHREPVGVVGAIVPWNFPLMIGAWKLAPAIAAGNSVVLKPAESASLSLLRLVELASEAGLPDGVFNVVTGPGRVTGEALAMSMDVDVLVFTGSGGTGRRLLEYSARSNIKRCYLELGGKSPNAGICGCAGFAWPHGSRRWVFSAIRDRSAWPDRGCWWSDPFELGGKSPNVVFADAPDLPLAARVSAMGIFRNSGQVCVAGSRLLVERSIHDDFVAMMVDTAKGLRVGDPLAEGTEIGALHSETELAANLDFVSRATGEGADIVTGGDRILEETGGTYMAPTILTGVEPDHHVAQNEVFGPVLAVTPFDTEAQAVEIANSTQFGLAAGVWTENLSRTHRMIGAIRAGVVHVNTYGGPDNTVPLGGVMQSGNGHDKSLHALDKCTDLKTAWIAL